jgi:hypothetical protein
MEEVNRISIYYNNLSISSILITFIFKRNVYKFKNSQLIYFVNVYTIKNITTSLSR